MARFGQGNNRNKKVKDPYGWGSSTVVGILKKREDLGHTVNVKTQKHFKDKKSHYVEPSNWVIFENTQEPIIDQATWDIVHRIRGNAKRYPNGRGKVNPLTGIVICADCGRPMHCHRTSNGKRIDNYVCANYTKHPVGTTCPTGHRVRAENIMELIRQTLCEIRAYVEIDEESFLQEIEQSSKNGQQEEIDALKRKKELSESRVTELEGILCRIYEDNLVGKLPNNRYEILSRQYESEQSTLKEELTVINESIQKKQASGKDGKKFLELIRKYDNFDEITPYMLNVLVEKVVVYERDRKGSVDTTQRIDIHFNFIGDYKVPQEPLSPEEQAKIDEERAKREAHKDRCHRHYERYKKTKEYDNYQKSYEGKRRARMAKLKAENPNVYGISIAQYREKVGEPKTAEVVGLV